jgi:hypothetical protein
VTGGRPRQGFIVTKALMAVEPPHIISCNEAKALGLKHYFTGRPCKYGHVAKRDVDGHCVECARKHWREFRAANLEEERERKRLYYAENKSRLLSQQAARRAADPQKHRDYMRRWRAANKNKQATHEKRLTKRAAARLRKDRINKRRAAAQQC